MLAPKLVQSMTSNQRNKNKLIPFSIFVQEASSIIDPLIWNEQQYVQFKRKNSWMYTINGKTGCTSCREVNNLRMRASRGVIISAPWAEGSVTSCGSTREAQLYSLPKKI